MRMYKSKGMVIAEYVSDNLMLSVNEELVGSVRPFVNGREEGCRIIVSYETGGFYSVVTYYVYAHRNSDKPTITIEDGCGEEMYSEEAYNDRTHIFSTVDDAVEFISIDLEKRMEETWK